MVGVPTNPYEVDTGSGLTWYWVIFGCMAGSALLVAVWTFAFMPLLERAHGYCTLAILCVASTAYYTMAVNQGYVGVQVDNSSAIRAIYWARYIDWFLTTPLLLLDILLMTDLPLGKTLWILAADDAMILLGLFASLTYSTQGFKWGFYALSCVMQIALVCGLVDGFASTRVRGPAVRWTYACLASYLIIVWFGYPIVWGLAEGSNTISSTDEAGAYGMLDFFTKVVFGWAIMFSVPALRGSYRKEQESGLFDRDLLGAPTYAPFSHDRRWEEHGLLSKNGNGGRARPGARRSPTSTAGTAGATATDPAAGKPGAATTRAAAPDATGPQVV